MKIDMPIENEIPRLTEISKNAFDTDITVGCDSVGGPPDYDSERWHLRMLRGKHLYAIRVENRIIGGALLFRDGRNPAVMYLGRIFIDPEYHRMGYGVEAMSLMESMFPNISIWRLETPDWNVRTARFYRKIGYSEMKREKGSVYYQKITGKTPNAITPR